MNLLLFSPAVLILLLIGQGVMGTLKNLGICASTQVRHRALHYKNLPMQYTEIFLALKFENFQLKNFDIFLIFDQNIDCGHMSELPHNLSFGAKIRKVGIPLHTLVFFLYKSGVQWGIHYTDVYMM